MTDALEKKLQELEAKLEKACKAQADAEHGLPPSIDASRQQLAKWCWTLVDVARAALQIRDQVLEEVSTRIKSAPVSLDLFGRDALAEHVRALKSQPQPSQGWLKITDDIKDGRRVLLKFRNDLQTIRDDLEQWNDLEFVGRNVLGKDGYDYDWNFAAPVGMGGFPDKWFVGYMPLPSPPADKVTT